VPIRLRLTLLMVLGAAVLAAVTSSALALSLEGGARATLQQVLLQRSHRVVAALKAGYLQLGSPQAPAVAQIDQSVVQIVAATGAVQYTTNVAGAAPLVRGSLLRQAGRGPIWLELRRSAWSSPHLVLAAPAALGSSVVVVGTSLDQIDDMMRRVVVVLLIGCPLVVVVTAIAAWLLTGGALAPVERLRAEAAEISAADLRRRLRVPGTHDELTALATTLNQLLEELDSALRRQRHFVAAAGHELRTPLARVRGELELALRSGSAPGPINARLQRTIAGVDRLTRVISELLVLARDDDGRLRLRPSPHDLGSIAASELSTFRARANQLGVMLVLNAEPEVVAEVDELWLRHALDNLLDNALRYSPNGSAVDVAVRAVGAGAVIEVSDRGPGFPSEVLSQPFQRFGGRTSGAAVEGDTRRGTGLGLWIVGMVMNAHQGQAEIANRRDGGATISLHLPGIATGGSPPLDPPPPVSGPPDPRPGTT
jgi:hypothetical protein